MTGAVLVTGATGFVGSHLTRRLVAMGHDVHIICRETSNFWRLGSVAHALTRHVAAIEDRDRVAAIIREVRPAKVFHLAAAAMVAGHGADAVVPVDLTGSINLIDACTDAGVGGVVTTGDSFEYAPALAPLSEADCCRPENLHGIAKLAATFYAQAAAKRGLPVVTLRLFSTYGPFDNPKRLVPKMIAGALAGSPLLLSRPEIARDWIFIDDLVDLYLEAAARAPELAGGVFNAGTGVFGSLGDVVGAIVRLTGFSGEVRWGHFPAPAHDDFPWVANIERTFAHFAWRPRMSLDAGLAACIKAYRESAV